MATVLASPKAVDEDEVEGPPVEPEDPVREIPGTTPMATAATTRRRTTTRTMATLAPVERPLAGAGDPVGAGAEVGGVEPFGGIAAGFVIRSLTVRKAAAPSLGSRVKRWDPGGRERSPPFSRKVGHGP